MVDRDPVIDVSGLTKTYGDITAVQSLSFSVAAGEVLGLVGPNGAGKTTTLRSMCGIVNPTEGTIRIAGHDLRTDGPKAKRQLAFIPDEPQLFDYLTVEEHLRFIGRLYGVAEAPTRAPILLESWSWWKSGSRFHRSFRAACGRSLRSPAACCTRPRR